VSRRRFREAAFRAALRLSVAVGVLALVTLMVQVTVKGLPRIDAGLVTHFHSFKAASAGAQAAIWGTIWLIGVVIVTTVPLGVGAAVYLEEYADRDRWWNRAIEINIQNLAAVPSIVYGILGLAFFVRGPLDLGPVILAGGLTLALLVLPIVIIAAREAIRAVPPSIREGSLALGATKLQTVRRQILPAAVPGIATGSILALSRAIGEAAPLVMLGAVTFIAYNPDGLDSRFAALPVQIFEWIKRPDEEFKVLAAAAIVVMLGLLLLMNASAIWLRNRYERTW
jgi:phosphate transport system permease protein